MSSKVEGKTEVKVDNRQKALDRIQAVMNKFKLIKSPVIIQDVVKHVYGDLSNDPDRADRAFNLVSKMINELVDAGDLNAYSFVNAQMQPGQETPSIITETLLVLPSFQLVGYVPASFEDEVNEEPRPSEEDEEDEEEDADRLLGQSDTGVTDDVLNEMEISEVLIRHTEAYAIVAYDKKGKQKPVIVRHQSEAALGKYLSTVADGETTASLYAMVPVDLTVNLTVEKTDAVVAETEEKEAEETAA